MSLIRDEELRKASGEVAFSDPLTTFLYLLMRNELAAGKVEAMVREAVDSSEECLFTNGWLAQYANNLAEEIKDAKANHLKSALEKAFVEHKEEKIAKASEEIVEKAQDVKDSANENFGDKTLSELEQKLIQISGESKVTDAGDEKPKTSGEIAVGAKEAVQQLVASGFMSQEDADDLKSDISDVVADAEKPVGDAEEIVKEHTENEKWTPEKAGHVVKKAFSAFERADKLETTEADTVASYAGDSNDTTHDGSGSWVSVGLAGEIKTSPDGTTWTQRTADDEMNTKVVEPSTAEDTTHYVDATGATEEDVEKWKNTHEELQNQEKDETKEVVVIKNVVMNADSKIIIPAAGVKEKESLSEEDVVKDKVKLKPDDLIF